VKHHGLPAPPAAVEARGHAVIHSINDGEQQRPYDLLKWSRPASIGRIWLAQPRGRSTKLATR